MPYRRSSLSMSRRSTISVDELSALNLAELKALWSDIFPSSVPCSMPREFLVKLLTQGCQERALSGFPKRVEHELALALNEQRTEGCLPNDLRGAGLGTRLVRGWGGTKHEVIVMEKGFAYRGKAYRSLSEIARLITGAHWSGPRFFGLKKNGRSPTRAAGELE
jgi:hypothetical protein